MARLLGSWQGAGSPRDPGPQAFPPRLDLYAGL